MSFVRCLKMSQQCKFLPEILLELQYLKVRIAIFESMTHTGTNKQIKGYKEGSHKVNLKCTLTPCNYRLIWFNVRLRILMVGSEHFKLKSSRLYIFGYFYQSCV